MKNLKLVMLLTVVVFGFAVKSIAQNNGTKNIVASSGSLIEAGIVSNGYEKYKASFNNGDIIIEHSIYNNGIAAGVEGYNMPYKEVFRYKVGGNKLKVQSDGNLVAYDYNDKAVWSTGTNGRGGTGTILKIQNDGNLVLYNGSWYGGDGDALWATGTCGGKENGCGTVGTR